MALKENALTPYIALGKTNPQEFPRNPSSLSKIKRCKILMWPSLSLRQPERCSVLIQLGPTLLLHLEAMHLYNKGKMTFYLYVILTILLCLTSRYSSVESKPELQKNILKFGYGINYKYEGMLTHSFDRFYVITKFILLTLDDLKLSPIRYDKDCKYICNLDDQNNEQIKQNLKDLLLYCAKLRPYMAFYKMQIKGCNITAHHILKNELDLILQKFYESHRSKREILSTLISGFIGLAFEGISSFLHHKAMSILMDAQRNKLMHLENTLVMYRIYNAETLEISKNSSCHI